MRNLDFRCAVRIASSVLLLGGTAAIACAADEAKLVVSLAGEGDRARQIISEKQATIEIESRKGIGRAHLEPVAVEGKKVWPERLTMRLALRGLEGFRVRAGNLEVTSSEKNETGEAFSYSADGKSRSAPVPEGCRLVIRKREGGYDVEIPALLYRDATAIDVQWIDFYR